MEYPYKLSIITINLNNKEGLQKTIDSVMSQTCKDFEWIVIDGGSDDGSRELIEKYDENINYWVSEPDKGIYNAMNKGIVKSNGEYLLFLNSGDYLYNEQVIDSVFNKIGLADFYVGFQLQGKRIIKVNIDTTKNLIFTLCNYPLPHQSLFIKKNVFKKYGLYREDLKIFSDWVFSFQTLILGNSSIENLNFIVSVFDISGISSTKDALPEWNSYKKEIPIIDELTTFYINNYEYVNFIKSKKLLHFLYRCIFYFYRKIGKYKVNQ